jgi:outer membrane protein W
MLDRIACRSRQNAATQGRHLSFLCLFIVPGLAASSLRAEDSAMFRPYIQARSAAFNENWGQRDGWGLSLGANLNYHFGIEVAFDTFQQTVSVPQLGAISEVAIQHLTPEFRFRYPLGDGRWVPYFIAGPGVTFLTINDSKPPAWGHDIKGNATKFSAVVGLGLEYFVADNVTFSIEGKYEWVQNDPIYVDGVRHDKDFSAPLLMFGIRAYFREVRHHPLISQQESVARIYGGFRYGTSILLDQRLNKTLRMEPVVNALGGIGNQAGSVLIGGQISQNFSLELSGNYNEYTLTSDTLGRLGKYANYTILPSARWHWLLLDGKLAPFVSAGLGLTYGEFAHAKSDSEDLTIHGKGFYPAAKIGTGAEYFIARNLSFSAETYYFTSWEHKIQINGVETGPGSYSALELLLGMRFYLYERGK